jgi:hypothetical protein
MLLPSIVFMACERPVHPSAATVVTSTAPQESTPTLDNTALEGWWILTEFHDSVMVHHRIGRYRMPTPVWGALMLNVRPDSLDIFGTLSERGMRFQRHSNDTLLSADLFVPMTILREGDAIKVMGTDRSRTCTMHYRRLRQEEMRLIDSLDVPDPKWRFQENYHAYLLRAFFVGYFKALDTGQFSFRIDDRGHITGHPNWANFDFHDYFGTLHPYANDMDALWFEDLSLPPRERSLLFNWRYSGDTLILVPMTDDGDHYELGEGKYRYLRERDR